MTTAIGMRTFVASTIAICISSCRAAEKSMLDYGSLKNIATVCEKDGDIWAVHYGENQQGFVVYVIFNKGKGESPVSTGDALRSDGSHDKTLEIQIDGRTISPPDSTNNLMIVVDGKVTRGHFKPVPIDRFQKILRDRSSPISALAEDADTPAKRTSK